MELKIKEQLIIATESLKKDLKDCVDRFHKATDIMPSGIDICIIETTRITGYKEFILGPIDIKLLF